MNFEELIRNKGTPIKKKKGEHVFRQGDSDVSLYFLQSGLLKAYYTSQEGKQTVKSFLLPNNVIGSLASVYSQTDCSFSLICLESCLLRKIPFEVIRDFSNKDIELANNMIELLLQFAIKKETREYELLCLSAEKRFSKIVKTSPTLLDKITQNDLARYLGVTSVGLSRIKKRVNKGLN